MPDSAREYPTSRRRLAVLLAVTRAIADAPGLVEGARKVIGALAESEGWSAGVVWQLGGHEIGATPPESGERMRCAAVWSAPGRPAPDLERAAWEASVTRGVGLAGRAWASGRTVFVGDLARDDELRREPRIEREGFRAAMAVPIPLGAFHGEASPAERMVLRSSPTPGAGLAGVIELFARMPREPDPGSEELLSIVGVELGRAARRVAVEHALARAEAALRRSEAQLIEADRLASLGALAAGVAHEINNPLSYVLLNLDLVIREASAGGVPGGETELVARLREARAGVERVRLIAQDLKSFSRSSTERRGPVDVRRVLDSTIEIAANEIRHRARLRRIYGDIPAVDADPSRLGQVFLNLLVNAAQAMVEGDASRHELRVATSTDAAGRVVVEFADTGAGIAPETMGRIFEPFFTTKPVGVGTGLGLSICRGIVTALGGDITVESVLGQGTTFRVILPAASSPAIIDEPTPIPAPTPSGPVSSVSPRRRGRVLVIDDEPALATALGRSIERDYEVVVISNGRQALERLRRDDAFDVILCDLIMPQLTGMDLYDELRRTAPALADRIIFMTGGTFTARAREFLARVTNPALDKPFDLSTLSALLRARTRR